MSILRSVFARGLFFVGLSNLTALALVGGAAESTMTPIEETAAVANPNHEGWFPQPDDSAGSAREADSRAISSMSDSPFVGQDGSPGPRFVSDTAFADFAIDNARQPDNTWRVAQVQATEAVPATESVQPSAPSLALTLGSSFFEQSLLAAFEQSLLAPFGADWLDAINGPTTDAGSVMKNARGNAQGTVVPTRTPIVHDTILRGRRLGQLPARGSYWFPARQDLDTTLSKIDSRLISEIISIKGPYSALYGPGLAFYDVHLLGAPRYSGGFESHGNTVLEYQTNGEQWHGRQSVWGGSTDWGFRIGYGHRTGSDYRTGAGFELPTSYKSRIPDVVLGADLTENSHVEFRYLRLDQTDVEFPGQMFDMNFLVTDAYEVKYLLENQPSFDRLTLESWYNRTRFEGDNLRPSKRRQIPSLDTFVPSPIVPGNFGRLESFTDVNASSTGFRLAFSWGEPDRAQLTSGADLRYLKQRLNEFNSVVGFLPPLPFPPFSSPINNPIPPAYASNPGLFLESILPLDDRFALKAGARVDWVATNADTTVPGAPSPDLEMELGGAFDQHFNLWSAFLSAEYQVNDSCTFVVGGGHAMRPPTMTELYAVDPFLSVMPQIVLTSAVGDPNLDPEELWQIDIGLSAADYSFFRGGIYGFYSWIEDYITFDSFFPSASYAFVNTDLATLSGGEIYGELDWNCWLTSFASMSYVEGRDHTRANTVSTRRSSLPAPGNTRRSGVLTPEEPLPVIPPFDSRVGLRIHAHEARPRWMLEFSTRIVDNQDRVATSLQEQPTAGFTTYDVRAYWQPYDDLLLTAGVENFTDKFYRTFYDTRVAADVFQPGITFYFGSELNY